MISLREAIQSALDQDPVLMSHVGFIDYPTMRIPKVFEDIAPKGTEAPYVVWQIIPGGDPPDGVFGDDLAILYYMVQFSAWGRTRREAWQVHEAADLAINTRDFNADIALYNLIKLKRQGNPFPLPDQDTSWSQVATTYEFVLGR